MYKKNYFLLLSLFLFTLFNAQGAAISQTTKEAFFSACTQKNYSKIKTTIDFFAQDKKALEELINSQDKDGNTPLLLLLSAFYTELIAIIRAIDSRIPLQVFNGQKREQNDQEALKELKSFETYRRNVFLLILDAKPDLNIRNRMGETALSYGIKTHSISLDLVKLFLNAGGDPLIRDVARQNTLTYALHLLGTTHNYDLLLTELLSRIQELKLKESIEAIAIIQQLHKTLIPYLNKEAAEKLLQQMKYFSYLISQKIHRPTP